MSKRADERGVVGERRWLWPSFALPGVLWLLVLFVTPLYAVLAMAMGVTDTIFGDSLPVWNPLFWDPSTFVEVLGQLFTGQLGVVFLRTLVYVVAATALSLLIGYPVAYYLARHAGRYRVFLLILIIAPFWINYLMRMLAWVNLLANDGLVNKVLPGQVDWLSGRSEVVVLGLVYGYVPYMIIPLYAGLDRLPQSLVEAARDLGASRTSAFFRVTLPMCRPIVVASVLLTCLPMLGDYYTADLLSGSPRTSMVGNLINETVLTPGQTGQAGAFVLLVLLVSIIPMAYYVRSVSRDEAAAL